MTLGERLCMSNPKIRHIASELEMYPILLQASIPLPSYGVFDPLLYIAILVKVGDDRFCGDQVNTNVAVVLNQKENIVLRMYVCMAQRNDCQFLPRRMHCPLFCALVYSGIFVV